MVVGNLLGATLAFVYFSFIDPNPPPGVPPPGPREVALFVVSFAVVVVAVQWPIQRGNRRLRAAGRALQAGAAAADVVTPEVQRLALSVPFRLALVSVAGWIASGLLWAVIWPAATGSFSPRGALRLALGIVGVGGAVTTAFVFFAVERSWRRVLPEFFPGGELGDLRRVPRLGVQARLTAAFLLVSLLPMIVLATVATGRARAVLGAAPAEAEALLRGLVVIVLFILAVGVLAAVVLSRLVARSVAEPLGALQSAMASVGRGDLDVSCPVVSHDELGQVTSGFNQMVRGLRERDRIKATFGKYVTDEIRDEILAGRVSLGGETRDVSVLFCDIRDFTPWVEATPPAEVVQDLNAYFGEMEEAIRAEGGLVLQYIGDEIEAVFGAPVRRPDHAARAVAAARSMRRRLAAWNTGGAPATAVGRCATASASTRARCSPATSASPDRLSYALVGDTVNLASRIQGLTKEVGSDIVISGVTAAALGGRVPLERLPDARLKGKSADVEVYRVV